MKDKVVIITGASSGIGLALVYECASRGAKIVMAARNIEKINALVKSLTDKSVESIAVGTDVALEEDCKMLIDKAIERFGKIDILINNAGISMRALFEDVDLSVLKRLMDVNFWGTVYCSKYALPYLLKTKGSIAGVSSIAGFKGLPARTGYSASKFAIHGFLETLRTENLKKDLHVLIACPGFTASNIRNTALTKDGTVQGDSPLKEENLMSAEEVARHISNAIVNRKRTLVLTTIGKISVFLNKFFPSFMDKMFYNHMAKELDSPLK